MFAPGPATVRIGIYGGTFNPPHRGHLIVAQSVRHQLSLEKVVLVPSFISPHKQDAEPVSGKARIDMLRLLLRGDAALDVSDCEILREGVSYTVDTLRHFRQLYPSAELFLMVGMDNFADFYTWRDPDEILEMATLIVMTRPGSEDIRALPEEGSRILLCRVPAIAISSSTIRERLRKGESVQYLVPERVREYIEKARLYHQELQN